MTMRTVVLQIHLWGALILGALLAFVCLTGSIAVLRYDVNQALHARGAVVNEPVSWDALVAAMEASEPGATWTYIGAPAATGGPVEVWWRRVVEGETIDYRSYGCPTTLTILGSTQHSTFSGVMQWLYRLHTSLHLGAIGSWLLGISALALLGFIITGLILWWPSLRRGWAAIGRIRWTKG